MPAPGTILVALQFDEHAEPAHFVTGKLTEVGGRTQSAAGREHVIGRGQLALLAYRDESLVAA